MTWRNQIPPGASVTSNWRRGEAKVRYAGQQGRFVLYLCMCFLLSDSATSDVFRFKCKRCPRTAISLSRMVEHVRSTHCQKKQFNDVVHDDVTFPSDSFMYEAQCKQCHEVFLGPRTAMTLAFQHMRTNHNRRMDHLELRCRACQRVFSTTSRQNSHILDRRHSCLVLSKRNFFKDSSGAGTSSSWPPAKKANLRLWSDGTNAAREKDLGHEDQRSALSVTSQDTQRTANVQSRESINIVDGNIATSANSSVYQCFYCPVKCKAAYAKKHLKVHVDNTFKCLICQVPVRFHTIQEARVHFRENHGITVTSHLDLVGESAHLSIPADCRCCSCTSCGIVFAAQDAFKLQTHVNKFHRGVAVPFHMYCRLCLTPFASYSKLFEHCWGRGGRPFCVPPQAWDNLAAVVTVLSACP